MKSLLLLFSSLVSIFYWLWCFGEPFSNSYFALSFSCCLCLYYTPKSTQSQQKSNSDSEKLTLVYDIETFPNYLLICFYNPKTNTFTEFEFWTNGQRHDVLPLKEFLAQVSSLIGFNNQYFDNLVLNVFLKTRKVEDAKAIADKIINKQERSRAFVPGIKTDYDVCGILDRKASLKVYQARMEMRQVLESQIPFDKEVEFSLTLVKVEFTLLGKRQSFSN